MLPYGTLWKLDQMLHPAGPPRRRTVAMRRRQAFFYFMWAVLLVSVFLLPYHYTSLRRLRLHGARRLRGDSAPEVDMKLLTEQQDAALGRLGAVLAMHREGTEVKESHGAGASTPADFSLVFHYHAATETRVRGMFNHPTLRTLAGGGGGGGALWAELGSPAENATQDKGRVAQRRPTLAEAASPSALAATGTAAICLAALRRDSLLSRVGSAADGAGLIRAVRTALGQVGGDLRPLSVSAWHGDGAMNTSDETASERALAQLFLWLANDTDASEGEGEEEAIAHAVASCRAPLSRSLHASFEWRVRGDDGNKRADVFANVQEVQDSQPQYVCLCSGRVAENGVALEEQTANASPGLFLVDSHDAKKASLANCAEVCVQENK